MNLRLPIAGLALLMLSGCETTIEIENLPTKVSAIGPMEASNRVQLDDGTTRFVQVSVNYSLWDEEGDDAALEVEICEADGSACGAPVRGYGGDGTSRLPTTPYASDVPHVFEWAVGCGRVAGGERIATDVSTEYVVRIRVINSGDDYVESASFVVGDLGISESTPCI